MALIVSYQLNFKSKDSIFLEMRKRFEQSPELDFCPISEVEINRKSRHQLGPLLIGLQYIFTNRELSEQVLEIIESKVLKCKNNTGRQGMSLWEILVLGVVRLNLDIDYDFLLDQANNHNELRGILGVQTIKVFNPKQKKYNRQTIVDNVTLVDAEAIEKINEVLVKAGHEILKKKEEKEILELRIKSDSYAVESNIHFPTDINLSWDSARKILDTLDKIELKEKGVLIGWRKRKAWRVKIKKQYRMVSNIHAKKGANYAQRINASVTALLSLYQEFVDKIEISIKQCQASSKLTVALLGLELLKYQKYLKKFSDQLDRRILKGEKIPSQEKKYSIFEPEVEWLQKGKQNNKVELGHNVLVTTDQYNFIIDYKVMLKESDSAQPLDLMVRLEERYGQGYHFKSISFDRGFYSHLSKEGLQKYVDKLIMPKKGKPLNTAKTEEQEKEYKKLLNKHSAIESNINELEHSGVNKVPDKGLKGFIRYVGYGVLAYNVKRLGRLIMDKKTEPKPKARAA